MARQEQEIKTRRREEARRRTRDLLLERAKQRLHAVAVAAAATPATNTVATARGIEILTSEEGNLSEGIGGHNDGVPAAGDVGGVRKAEGSPSLWDLGGQATGVPLYAQETWATKHGKVCTCIGEIIS